VNDWHIIKLQQNTKYSTVELPKETRELKSYIFSDQEWWYTVIPALGRLRQENKKFVASLG
jgi:hypothetical protein